MKKINRKIRKDFLSVCDLVKIKVRKAESTYSFANFAVKNNQQYKKTYVCPQHSEFKFTFE